MSGPTISIIIPAYNEADYIPRLLDSIDAARARLDDPNLVEVVIGDNMSTDATAQVAADRGCTVARVEKRAIAAARNGGAAVASGEVLCFCDSDTRVHPDTFAVILEKMNSGEFGGGAMNWKLERSSLALRITESVVRVLTGLARVGGVVMFCRADIFHEIGGFPEDRKYAEDVAFYAAMRKASKKRGLKTEYNLPAPATVSVRKFDRHGDWHMLFMPLWILKNRSMEKTVEDYWYNDSERF